MDTQSIAYPRKKASLPKLGTNSLGKLALRFAPREREMDEPKRVSAKARKGFD
jgi:hypothetical protein